jgi:DNA-binding response OmpR family regulator
MMPKLEPVGPRPDPAVKHPEPACLLVDDDPLLLAYLAAVFRARGYEVLTATSGREAFRIARERRQLAFVLLDIGLPGPDGLQVLWALRQTDATRDIPVVMLTAREGDESLITALNRGADDYLTKPIAPDKLVARVHELLWSKA